VYNQVIWHALFIHMGQYSLMHLVKVYELYKWVCDKGMVCPQVAGGCSLPIWMPAANTINKQSQTGDKSGPPAYGWSPHHTKIT
jgi:hypothetical protein